MRNRKKAVLTSESRKGLRVHAGTIWINRMGKHRRIPAEQNVPKGWTRGRLPFTEEHKQNLAAAFRGSHWIHKNGQSKRLAAGKPIPKGWYAGYDYIIPTNKLGQFQLKEQAA
jgi:hypothetical protein